ncbi:response regulator transcription factor [Microbacterium trichothecenolyticum]|uniref:DNA-binding response OmpR family regulator n=1 Tax=Microbacterium trichothecenolyticum TaxID=69370 RepID=A0ABU0TTZ4_MICTR|nr:response regulator [Microbacterium trichothecenolyticum]MDQ1122417.1 DNA-binding response OmpR family regulator [Microbacterium trichothecenolyticum]
MTSSNSAVVIEDDLDIRTLIAAVLADEGFDVHAAPNGIDGIELVRRYTPLITTLDVSMPGIDGFEAARRIRAFSSTRILMLTARIDALDRLTGSTPEADDYLTKPFRPRELRERVRKLTAPL